VRVDDKRRASLIADKYIGADGGPPTEEEINRLVDEPAVATAAAEAARDQKQVDILVGIASEAELFHNAEKTAFATITLDGHGETHAVMSQGFRSWLRHRFYKQTNGSPGSEVFKSALNTIEAKALYEGDEHEVYLRIAGHQGAIYIDIGDKHWRVLQVTSDGWSVIDKPPVRFRRAATMLPLPLPVLGGSIAELKRFLNVPDDNAFVLAVAFILGAMRPTGPYTVLSLHGPAGTAKSTFSEVIRRLIDPGKPMLRSLPKEKVDLFIAANNNHVVAFENVSHIPTWLSDLMCTVSTGGGLSRRELYTDFGEVTFDVQRPQIVNGIVDFIVRGDLADRAIPLVLRTIEQDKRRYESKFWSEFEAAAPRILGALLTALANGLRHLRATELKVLPRMADFAIWATACETGALWVEGLTFVSAYARNREEATAIVLEDDHVARVLQQFMVARKAWEGNATQLLKELTMLWGGDTPDHWPKGPNKLSNRIRRVQPQLAQVGLTVHFDRSERQKTILLSVAAPASIVRTVIPSLSSNFSSVAPDDTDEATVSGIVSGSPDGSHDDPDDTRDATSAPTNPLMSKGNDDHDDHDDTFPPSRTGVCQQCGRRSLENEFHKVGDAYVELHKECVRFWDGTPHPTLR
jgi:hypothetical protein